VQDCARKHDERNRKTKNQQRHASFPRNKTTQKSTTTTKDSQPKDDLFKPDEPTKTTRKPILPPNDEGLHPNQHLIVPLSPRVIIQRDPVIEKAIEGSEDTPVQDENSETMDVNASQSQAESMQSDTTLSSTPPRKYTIPKNRRDSSKGRR
jgi:hypothetical protein